MVISNKVFDSADMVCFQEYHRDSNPNTFDDFLKEIANNKLKEKNKISLL